MLMGDVPFWTCCEAALAAAIASGWVSVALMASAPAAVLPLLRALLSGAATSLVAWPVVGATVQGQNGACDCAGGHS